MDRVQTNLLPHLCLRGNDIALLRDDRGVDHLTETSRAGRGDILMRGARGSLLQGAG